MQSFLVLSFPQLGNRVQKERIAKEDNKHEYVSVMFSLIHCNHEAVPFHKQSENQEYSKYFDVCGQWHREPSGQKVSLLLLFPVIYQLLVIYNYVANLVIMVIWVLKVSELL